MSILLSLAFSFPVLTQQQPEDGRGQGLFSSGWHAERRAALMEKVGKGVIVLRGAGTQNDYREFRQDNNFWYFTGVTTPNAVLVMVPSTGHQTMLVPHVSPGAEIWQGDLIDPEEAKHITGIEDCRLIGKIPGGRSSVKWDGLEDLLGDLAKEHDTFYVQGQPAENWMMSRDNLRSAAGAVRNDPYDGRKTREGQFAGMLREKHGVKTKDITVSIDALRVFKTPEEIEAMRGACRISGIAHEEVMKTAKAGDLEWKLAAAMTGAMLANGAMGAGYMAIVGSGPNACILHYSTNNRTLEAGDVVMIDYGAEYSHYIADISRSWPVSGKWTKRQREVYQAVYDAQEAAFEKCKPGSSLMQVHAAAAALLRERGFGEAFWHGTSHWLGMATHDVGASLASFKPGVAFTVEPGVYLPEEGIGVRIEDVVVITEDGYELISGMIPRHPDHIEKLRSGK